MTAPANLPPLADIADLEAHLGHPVDPASGTAALENASGWVRSWCGWVLSREPTDIMLADSDGTDTLDLPTLWINAVTQVIVAGITLTEDPDDPYGYTWSRAGQLFRPAGWPKQARAVSVFLDHGYEPIPHAIRGAVVAIAGRNAENPSNVRMETVGTVIRQYHELTVTTLDTDVLGPYRLPMRP